MIRPAPGLAGMIAPLAIFFSPCRAQVPSPPAPPPPSAASSTEPPALTAARAQFLSGVVLASKQLSDQFSNALAKLEDELAAAGDYEEAIKVQTRRKEVEASVGSAGATPLSQPGVALSPNTAKTSAAVTVEDGALTGWRTAGNYAEWSLQKLTPGRYTLQFGYTSTESKASDSSLLARATTADVVKFKFSEVSLLAAATASTRLLELPLSKDPATYTPLVTEPISIARTSITFRLESMQSTPANAIRIKDIRLVPVEDRPAATSVPSVTAAVSGGQQDIDALKQIYTRQLASARSPIITDYLARLKSLAAQPAFAKDRDLVEEIEAEQRRITEMNAGPSDKNKGGIRRRGPAGVAGGLDGFDDITDARLVNDPANSAERFKVEHEGRTFFVKLAWVRCPPVAPDDKEALQLAMRHFKIDEDEALAVGRMAQEFTIGYLEDRPLRLLVRTKKEKKNGDDASPALVFLDDIGLFQTALVQRGLAAVVFPPGLDHKSTMENGMMRMLTEQEQKAMKRRPAPGAWSFTAEAAK